MTAKKLALFGVGMVLCVSTFARGQTLPIVTVAEPQPFIAQAMRLVEALEFLGSELPDADARRLEQLRDEAPSQPVVEEIQRILDPFALAMVQINPEARVSVARGPAPAELVQGGWKAVLVKVHNAGSVRGGLEIESPMPSRRCMSRPARHVRVTKPSSRQANRRTGSWSSSCIDGGRCCPSSRAFRSNTRSCN